MSNYQRLISYIYTYEGGIKGKNTGFAKLEERNGQCRLTVSVKKIFVGGNPMGVYLLAGDGEIRVGTMFARNGAGEFRAVLNARDVEGSGRTLEECYGLTVHDADSSWRAYTTIWEDAVARAAEVDLAQVTAENARKKERERGQEDGLTGGLTGTGLPISSEIERELEQEERTKEERQENVKGKEACGEKKEGDGHQTGAEAEGEAVEGEKVKTGNIKTGNTEAEKTKTEKTKTENNEAAWTQPEKGKGGGETGEADCAGTAMGTGKSGNFEEPDRLTGAGLAENGGSDAGERAAEDTAGYGGSPEAIALAESGRRKEEGGQEPENWRRQSRTEERETAGSLPERSARSLIGRTGPVFSQPGAVSPEKPSKSVSEYIRGIGKNEEGKRESFPAGAERMGIILEERGKEGERRIETAGAAPGREQGTAAVQPPGADLAVSGENVYSEQYIIRRGRYSGQESGTGEGDGEPRAETEDKREEREPGDLRLGVRARLIGRSVPPPQKGGDSFRRTDRAGGPRRGQPRSRRQPTESMSARSWAEQMDGVKAAAPMSRELLSSLAPDGSAAAEELLFPDAGYAGYSGGSSQGFAPFDTDEAEQCSHQRMWARLRRKYPKILAFDYDDGCEILTIKPQDIGLLPRETWVFGNNSFLLHGYYSYRYLILARLENPDGEPRYLLGVPGHYHPNEKYMASMFGFPDFVLSKRQPSGDDSFGYWYTDIRVGE